MSKYRKAAVAAGIVLSEALAYNLVPEQYVSYVLFALGVLGAYGVYRVPNAE